MYSDYLKIPFVDMGRDKTGVDCYGLVCLYYKRELGIILPEYLIPPQKAGEINSGILHEKETGRWEEQSKPERGTVILFNLHNRHTVINHIGVYIGGNRFIHTLKDHGVSLVRLPHYYFTPKIRGFYKWL